MQLLHTPGPGIGSIFGTFLLEGGWAWGGVGSLVYVDELLINHPGRLLCLIVSIINTLHIF